MNVKLYFIHFCSVFHIVLGHIEVKQVDIENDYDSTKELQSRSIEIANDDVASRGLRAVVHRTVNKYYCSVHSLIPSHLIVYGTNSWTFPTQDVNLTLSYPTENSKELQRETDEDQFIITGFKVVLYIDGEGSRGFITSGGLLQESISLSFVSSSANSLGYQFWVYGVTKHADDIVDLNANFMNYDSLCT